MPMFTTAGKSQLNQFNRSLNGLYIVMENDECFLDELTLNQAVAIQISEEDYTDAYYPIETEYRIVPEVGDRAV